MPDSATVAEALKQLDRDLAKQALAAKVGGREVDLAAPLDTLRSSNGEGTAPTVQIEPIVPQTRDGLEVLRHSTAHLLAAAVLDLFPGTKLGIGPRCSTIHVTATLRRDNAAPLTEADLPTIEKRMKQIASKNLGYRREALPNTKRYVYLVNATSR